MHFASPTLQLLAVLPLAAAHFTVQYPFWRGDAFADTASEWIWPCANISQEMSGNNRTAWPLSGGSLAMKPSHPWALTYINLGIGNEVTAFNISLVENFNQTGNGSFCIPELRTGLAELGIPAGTNASLQIIQISHSGSALYNCADITLTDDATLLSGDACTNSTGVGGVEIGNIDTVAAANVTSNAAASGTSAAAAQSSSGAASATVIAPVAGVVGVVAFFLSLV